MKSPALIASVLLALAATTAGAQQKPLPPIVYANKDKPGPQVIVLPGEIKTSDNFFKTKYSGDNIADFAELELGNDGFKVLERADLSSIIQEFQTAYALGDTATVKKYLKNGKLHTTKYILRFDILKAEKAAVQHSGINGAAAVGAITSIFHTKPGAAGDTASTLNTDSTQATWLVGMRYKIIDANTTEIVAQGYHEETLDTGGSSTQFLGISGGEKKPFTLDSMVQRLIQENVAEIDAKYK